MNESLEEVRDAIVGLGLEARAGLDEHAHLQQIFYVSKSPLSSREMKSVVTLSLLFAS